MPSRRISRTTGSPAAPGARTREDVAGVAEAPLDHVGERRVSVPAGGGDDGEVNVAVRVRVPTGQRAEDDHGLHVVARGRLALVRHRRAACEGGVGGANGLQHPVEELRVCRRQRLEKPDRLRAGGEAAFVLDLQVVADPADRP